MKYLVLLLIMLLPSVLFAQIFPSDEIIIEDSDEPPTIYTNEFDYKVLESKGYKSQIEENKKGSFSGKEEDTGILDVFIIEVTLKIKSKVGSPEPIKRYKHVPEKIIIKEQGSSIEIYKEPEKTIELEPIIPQGNEGPNLKVKVKEKLYNPYQGIIKKKMVL